MATALPSSFSFEMLSRLPSQSFELQYREIRPDVEPNGGVYPVNQDSRVSFHIRGAPNEIVLNTSCYVGGSVSATVDYSAVVGDTPPGDIESALFDTVATAPRWKSGPPTSSSRESFNSGALPYLDNQDKALHLVHNNLRAKFARRHADPAKEQIDDLAAAGWSDNKSLGFNVKYQDAGGIKYLNRAKRKFQVPLGFYSSMINSHSICPVGLMSAYSVNGWSVEVTLPNVATGSGLETGVINLTDASRPVGLQNGVVASDANKDGYRDVRIFVPIIKILDPAVMASILSLYEKRETVNIGGAQFPVSLRMNSLGYRTYQFPLQADQGDYYFRLPSTDRSVRGFAWMVVDRTADGRVGVTDVGSVNGQNNLALTRIQTRIGSRLVHEPVEDRNPETGNVTNFLGHQSRRSGALYSPFPSYQEAIHHSDDQSDKLYLDHWAKSAKSGYQYSINDRSNIQYGQISLENLDHREPEYSGSFQASGYDLTNVGGIDLEMRFAHISAAANNVADADKYLAGPDASKYTIAFIMCHDVIHEISPSGVIDITNSVL